MKQLFITSIRDWENNKMGTVEMREVPVPEPGEEEIRVRIAYSAFLLFFTLFVFNSVLFQSN